VLEPDVITLLESDAVIVVGTVDHSGVPEATRGWGLRVLDGTAARARVRVLLPVDSDRTHANLATTGRIAVTVTDVVTLASTQVKGRVTESEPPTPEDAREHERSFAALAAKIHDTDGTPPEILARFRPGPLTAVIATVEEVYDQTPGPVAGTRLAPTAEPT
jgi:hypothetical protein